MFLTLDVVFLAWLQAISIGAFGSIPLCSASLQKMADTLFWLVDRNEVHIACDRCLAVFAMLDSF